MNRTEILEKLNEVFHDVFDNNDIVVTEQTNANDIEEWEIGRASCRERV